MFSEHSGMEIEVNNSKKKKLGKLTNTWKLNSTFLSNHCVKNWKGELENALE